MEDREEWGPWQDGATTPPKGRYVRLDLVHETNEARRILYECIFIELVDGVDLTVSPPIPDGVWFMERWQERKPRALIQLREMIETLPSDIREPELI